MKRRSDDVALRNGVPFVQHASAVDAALLGYPWVTSCERVCRHGADMTVRLSH